MRRLLGTYPMPRAVRSRTLGWLFAIIWSIDPIVSSCLSYERARIIFQSAALQGLDGTWELRASRTFRKYLRGFFFLDVVLAILSWVELVVSSQPLGW